jgi:hypothetical protein
MTTAVAKRTREVALPEKEEIKHVQIRLPLSRYQGISYLAVAEHGTLQDIIISAIDQMLAKPSAEKFRDLAGMKDVGDRRTAFFEHANRHFIGAVDRIIDAWFETQKGK